MDVLMMPEAELPQRSSKSDVVENPSDNKFQKAIVAWKGI